MNGEYRSDSVTGNNNNLLWNYVYGVWYFRIKEVVI